MRVELRVAGNSTNKLATRDYVRRHLRVDNRFEDDLIESYVQVATRLAENYTNRSFLTKSYVLTLAQNQTRLGGYTGYSNLALPYGYYPNFYLNPLSITLPFGPLQSVTSIVSGNWDTAAPASLTELSDFYVQADTGQLVVSGLGGTGYNFGASDYMSIEYLSGYGDTPASVPPDLVHAVMLITASLYINRGDDDREPLTPGARALLDSYRSSTFGTFYG